MHARTTIAILVATFTAAAQNDYNLDKVTSARLGTPLTLQVSNAPGNQFLLFLVSNNAGPTPLALIDPTDPRSVAVGLDLLGAASVALTTPTGGASLSLALPNNPTLSNIVLHWQSVVLAFGTPFFGQLGNDVVTQTGLQDAAVPAADVLSFARGFATAIVDRNNNGGQGDVLIAGGGQGTLIAAIGLQSSELWDFRRMDVSPGPNLTTARALHLAVRLADDRVLVIGGVNAAGATLASCEIYDPNTNSFSPTGSMGTPRVLHAACLLADGRVMVAGGTSTLQPDAATAIAGTLNSVEFWSPTAGTWSPGPALGGSRLGPALTRLSTNQVMASGGVQVTFFLGLPLAAVSTTAVQLWDPTTNAWSPGASMAQGRAGHHYNQVTLLDNRVLMTGGVNVPSLLGATAAAPIAGAELYNPTTNTWQTVNMPNARALHTATRLPDGRVVVAGGAQGTLLAPVSIANVDVFSPIGSWAPAPALPTPRGGHTAELLPDGTLLLFGGQGPTVTLNTIETLRFF